MALIGKHEKQVKQQVYTSVYGSKLTEESEETLKKCDKYGYYSSKHPISSLRLHVWYRFTTFNTFS